jgi:hypothetical protein
MWLIVGKYAIIMGYLMAVRSTTTAKEQKMPIQKFAGVLSFQLFAFADS